jgi:4-amino-4-deoxy-L-arabinose transferase-like glycosyltransferase
MLTIQRLLRNNSPVLILAGICLITRIINITVLPIFTDESIYIYWAKLIESTHSQWFVSLTDGKPPLLVWLIGALLHFLPGSMYLLAGRIPSVAAGVLSVIAIYKLTEILFRSQKMAIVSGVLYIITPFLLLYDRLALFDSLLTCMLLWSTYFAVRTLKTLKWSDAILWGIFLGLALLSKPTALIFWVLLPFCVGILAWKDVLAKKFPRLIMLSVTALILSQLMQSVERFSHVYGRMAEKNAQFQFTPRELVADPFQHMVGNIIGFFSWFIPYVSIPVFILGIIALFLLILKKPREGIVIFILWLVPILGLAEIGREIFPRYILFVTPYFLLPISFLIVWLWEKKIMLKSLSVALVAVIFVSLLPYDFLLLTNPARAPIPQADHTQLVSQHTSGYGLDKVFTFLDEKSRSSKIYVVTQGTFGLYHYAFLLHYWGNPRVEIVPRWPISSASDIPVIGDKNNEYIILKDTSSGSISPDLPLKIVLKAEKPGGKYPIFVTKLNE